MFSLRHPASLPTVALGAVLSVAPLCAHTTQGLISGKVINSRTGVPVAGASVTYTSGTLAATGTLKSDEAGLLFSAVALSRNLPRALRNRWLPVPTARTAGGGQNRRAQWRELGRIRLISSS